MGVSAAQLAMRYPRLYHMAARGSWPGIYRHGLLSTTALLDLFEVRGNARFALEAAHRPESVAIEHPAHGIAIIRDQKPMGDSGLRRALPGEIAPADWYRFLNGKVFFWLTQKRLKVMLEARAYRGSRHLALVVDTARLLARHIDDVVLSPLNSGCTKPYPRPRSFASFQPPADYPYEEREGRGLEPIVELAVNRGVPDISNLVVSLEEVGANEPGRVLDMREAATL